MKTEIKRNFLRLVSITMLLFAFVQGNYAVDIVGFTLATGTAGAATSGESINYPGKGRVLTHSGLANVGYSTTNGIAGNSWDNNGTDGFMTNSFSTVGYLNVTFVGQIKGQNGAPKYLKAQYSLNGSTWTDVTDHPSLVDDYPITTVGTSFPGSLKFRLPAECDNQQNVYIRMVQDGASTIGGVAPSSSAYIYMKSVVVQAEELAAPTSQSTQITIVSLTPTTITLGCTPGSGNRRYLVMNKTNSFTTPSDNFLPSANATYSGSGEQIIYVGTGTTVTVTVPSSLNTYWFRYFEYNQLDDLTRFSSVDASVSKNPKMCALPNIHTPTHSFGLIRASLGATIDAVSGDVGDIIDRGVFWSTTAGVTNNNTLVQEGGAAHGVFAVETEVDRGSTIYYRGYAENESGVILSAESSFNNTPIFTGTGNWETAARWNVQEVPGANGDPTYGSVEDSPIINGICTLTSDNNVTNLTINASRLLTINKATTMKVNGTLLNNAGVNGILIKSIDNKSDVSPNGSLIFANGTVQASVEMFSKALWNLSNPAGSRFTWQYFGIPFTSYAYSTSFSAAYVRAWDESVTEYYDVWTRTNSGTTLQLTAGSSLLPGVAYELCQQANKKYLLSGTLINSDYNKTLQYTPTAYYKGQNMLSNPYTAAMNIADLEFGANTTAAVYLYNSGTYNDWLSNSGESTPGSGPGTYTVSTPGTAGSGEVPAQIPSMQGFLVKATANPGSISYSYSNLTSNGEKQRAKSINNKVNTMIDLIGTKFSDRMWLFVDDNCTTGFDNGFDGPKLLGYNEVSQIYGIGTDDIYQINVLNDINEAYIGVQPGIETSFKVTFKHQNIDQKYVSLYLVDLVDNKTIDITSDGSEYSFTSTSTDPVKRFKIVGNTGNVTSNINNQMSDIKLFTQNNLLMIDNKLAENGDVKIFDLSAKLLSTFDIQANSINTLQTDLKQGVYLVQIKVGLQNLTQRVIIK